MLRRQLIALDWLFARFQAHVPPENILRYEDLVESGGLDAVATGWVVPRPGPWP